MKHQSGRRVRYKVVWSIAAMVAALAAMGVGTGLATQGPLLMGRPMTAWPPAKAQLLARLQQEMDAARAHARPKTMPQAPPHQPDPARQAGIENDLHTGPFSAAEFTVRNLGQRPVGTVTNYRWTRRSPATVPPPRVAASMAYDAAVGKVVLFGGLGLSDLLNDTWMWDGRTWIQQKPAVSPPARVNASMAYDATRGKLVVFGGTGEHETRENGLQLNDTWTWDGTTWTKQQPRTSPPAREGASMAYDAATRTVVLFGGVTGKNNRVTTYLNDTWLWDGSTWAHAHPATAPGPRTGASMAYDGARGKLVLFGGGNGVQRDDTWTWDGSTWTRQHPATSPPARVYAASAYDDGARVVVLFGGVNIVGLTDTWTWDGTTWTKQHPVAAPASGQAVRMAYDAAQHSMVLISTVIHKALNVAARKAERPTGTLETWTT